MKKLLILFLLGVPLLGVAQRNVPLPGDVGLIIPRSLPLPGTFRPVVVAGSIKYQSSTGALIDPATLFNIVSTTVSSGTATSGITQAFADTRYRLSSDPISYSSLTGRPTIPTVPTSLSAFTNDPAFQTATQVATAIGNATTPLSQSISQNASDVAGKLSTASYTSNRATDQAATTTAQNSANTALTTANSATAAAATNAANLSAVSATVSGHTSQINSLSTATAGKVDKATTITLNGVSQPLSGPVSFTIAGTNSTTLTQVSQLSNDAGYQTSGQVGAAISTAVNSVTASQQTTDNNQTISISQKLSTTAFNSFSAAQAATDQGQSTSIAQNGTDIGARLLTSTYNTNRSTDQAATTTAQNTANMALTTANSATASAATNTTSISQLGQNKVDKSFTLSINGGTPVSLTGTTANITVPVGSTASGGSATVYVDGSIAGDFTSTSPGSVSAYVGQYVANVNAPYAKLTDLGSFTANLSSLSAVVTTGRLAGTQGTNTGDQQLSFNAGTNQITISGANGNTITLPSSSTSGVQSSASSFTYVTPYTRAAIQAAVDALPVTGGIVRLEPGKVYTYTTADRVSIVGKNNVTITCPSSATLDGGTLENELIFTNTTDRLTIENVFLRTTCTDFGYGLFFANESGPVTNLTLRRVGLHVPTVNMNAIAGIAWSNAANGGAGNGTFHSDWLFEECYTLKNGGGTGRMFGELQSTNFGEAGQPNRIRNVTWRNNRVYNTGLVDNANGMAFSNSGRIENASEINNIVENFRGNAFEHISTTGGVIIGNTVSGTATGTNGIVVTDGGNGAALGATGLEVGVNSFSVVGNAINTYYANNISFTGGRYVGQRLYLQNSARINLNGVTYVCTGGNETLYLDNTSDSQITGGTYVTRETGTTYQKIGFTNGAVRNTVTGVRVAGKPSANGNEITQSNTGNMWNSIYYHNTTGNTLTKLADQN